jgi:hypothetical protein
MEEQELNELAHGVSPTDGHPPIVVVEQLEKEHTAEQYPAHPLFDDHHEKK